MTRKDYEQIAAAFARVRAAMADRSGIGFGNPKIRYAEITALNCIENELCTVMQSDNPRFDDGIFRAASHAHSPESVGVLLRHVDRDYTQDN
jgi:hypothetical protein